MASRSSAQQRGPQDRHHLRAGEELVVEPRFGAYGHCTVTLTDGTAQVAGFEMASNVDYTFAGHLPSHVFSPSGCTVTVAAPVDPDCRFSGGVKVAKITSCIPQYTEVVSRLRELDYDCRTQGSQSSALSAMIVGAPGSGKSLTAQLVAQGMLQSDPGTPVVYVDADVGCNRLSGAGSVSAAVLHGKTPMPPNCPFAYTHPIAFFVGDTSLRSADLIGVYMQQCTQLHACVPSLVEQWKVAEVANAADADDAAGGAKKASNGGDDDMAQLMHAVPTTVVDTTAYAGGASTEAVTDYCRQLLHIFQPNVVLVCAAADDDGRGLVAQLEADLSRIRQGVTVIGVSACLPAASHPSAGTLTSLRSSITHNDKVVHSLLRYFDGYAGDLQPAKIVVSVSAVKFVRVGINHGGENDEQGETTQAVMTAVQVSEPSSVQRGTVCAVSHAQLLDEVPYANVAGLVVVLEVDGGDVVLLAPTQEAVPRRFLVVGGCSDVPLPVAAKKRSRRQAAEGSTGAEAAQEMPSTMRLQFNEAALL